MRKAILLGAMAVIMAGGMAAGLRGAETADKRAGGEGDAIVRFAEGLKVGAPRRHRNLTLYPVLASHSATPEVEVALDEAMDKGWLEIRELPSAQVNRVRLVNQGKKPVFLMGGEMIGGAKQDRIVGDDVVIPAGAKIDLPVFCVEQHRWVAASSNFHRTAVLAGSEVRKARAQGDQGAVWAEVASKQARLDAPSATGALRSVHESREVQDKARPYEAALEDLPAAVHNARGVVVVVDGEIIAADLFSSRALFRKLWPKLLKSYVVDALERSGKERRLDSVEIRRWLGRMARAERTEKETPGAGRLFELHGRGVMGSALVYRGGVVHVELFPSAQATETDFNRLQFRRDRLGRD